ncbi:MAG: 5-bromo-4-chloroindolyl phosphate hydrolysis family protein [Lachnospiraceae bacterium]|nr:5-bromo-4-chloroindolyl phosphate hydrolysis family protein [Lachnospiraceae bacterium]
MSRKRGRIRGLYIVGLIWLIFGIGGISITGVLSFLMLFGISLAVVVALARSAEKKDAQNRGNQGKVDTSASAKDNVNPYSSSYHQSAQAQINQQNAAQRMADERLRAQQAQQAQAQELERRKKAAESNLTSYGAQKRKRTGDKDIDALLDEEEKAIAEMRRLDRSIVDEKVSAQIVHLEEVTSKIVDCIVEKPKKRNQVKKFFSYYLPTTLKLLNSYDRMDDLGISGTNIDGTKGSIETLLDTALAAFDKELDSLYGDEAIDVTSDIKVMESMLAQDGLTDDELMKLMK